MNFDEKNPDPGRYRRDPKGYAREQQEALELRNPLLIRYLDLEGLDFEQKASLFHTLSKIKLPDFLPEMIIRKLADELIDPIDEYRYLGNRELLSLALCQTSLSGDQERRDQVRRRVGLVLHLRRRLT